MNNLGNGIVLDVMDVLVYGTRTLPGLRRRFFSPAEDIAVAQPAGFLMEPGHRSEPGDASFLGVEVGVKARRSTTA